ncbi:ferritin-like domain-containing protein (plasmid) [Deinococcus sp. KNUC1210]|uniref:ferritin-like domain-containing protein n=1 Tax=Deinococcus sp. KNUC1210 TaxID=2917691 RepID=UPI001EF0CAF9|nr:ferritin-like domain-containing protein [Deinococcus sp. KNUC1210]ULH13913.1 ferritin-like domain-containing protein [Deinococcus sp. KNUC1210]
MPEHTTTAARRRVLRDLLGTGGLLLADALAGNSRAAGTLNAPVPLLQVAATTEALSVSFYTAVLAGATFHIGDKATAALRQILATERHHLKLLGRLGGLPGATTFSVDPQVQTDARSFIRTAQHLAHLSAQTYLAATEDLAAHREAALAGAAARLAAREAQHSAVLAQLAGLDPLAAVPPISARRATDLRAALTPYLRPGAPGTLLLTLRNG